MRVLLLQDVKGLGKRGEIKEVKSGYGRNYLIPRKLAKIATPEVIKKFKIEQAKEEAVRRAKLEELNRLKKQIEMNPIVIRHKLGANGQLYGAVTHKEIAKKLQEVGISVDKREINSPTIKSVGEYQIDIKLGMGVHAQLKLIVEGK